MMTSIGLRARRRVVGIAAAASGLLPLPALAADGPATSGDIAWVLSASALVLFMTLPGLALFYGGGGRGEHLLAAVMHCFVVCCVISLLWAVIGYSLAFDGD